MASKVVKKNIKKGPIKATAKKTVAAKSTLQKKVTSPLKSKAPSQNLKKIAAQKKVEKPTATAKVKSIQPSKPAVVIAKKTRILPVKPGKVLPTAGASKLKQMVKGRPLAPAESEPLKPDLSLKKAHELAEKQKKALQIKQQIQEEKEAQSLLKVKKIKPEPVLKIEEPKMDDLLPPILTDAEGRPYCKIKDCDQIATVDGYCRYHYLLLWKRIQVRRRILLDGKLERYVEELTSRYPDKFLDVIRKDLLNEKNFLAAITELEIDESSSDSDFDDEDTQAIEEVRSFSDTSMIGDDDF